MRNAKLKAAVMGCAFSVMTVTTPLSAHATGYDVLVNGRSVNGAMAEMRNGQLMVAVRPFVKAMGGGIDWLQADYRATVHYHGSQLAVWMGSNTSFQDGKRLWTPVAPYTKNGSTMVPAWWLAARLGSKVSFDGGTLAVQTGSGSSQGTETPLVLDGDPLKKSTYFFPLPSSARYDTYYDTWGDARYFEGATSHHEGTDVAASQGTPIVAVASGNIVRYGWNALGGYRITVQLDDNPDVRFYYAHLDRYAPGLFDGAHVAAGQLIGYMGHTGEGPERTEGNFVPHLHFGIYVNDRAINPFPYLRFWEGHKAAW